MAGFAVIEDGEGVDDEGCRQDDGEMALNIGEGASFEQDKTHDFNEPSDGIEPGYFLGPVGHTLDGREEAAEQNENDEEEPGHEHGLLLRIGDGGDEESEAQEDEQVGGGEEKDEGEAALHGDVEDDFADGKPEGQAAEPQDPEG